MIAEEGFFLLALLPSTFVVLGGCLRGPKGVYAFVTSFLLLVAIEVSHAAAPGAGLPALVQKSSVWSDGKTK